MFEEFTFRGYLQSTLASGIGFWPAAILLAALFGAAHLGNPGEAQIGTVMAGAFGLVSAFALRRTGTLWLGIGMHASWDWGETYFFGTPDSGLLAEGHLLHSSFHGPAWLTGGSIGPEGSLFVFAVLIAWATIIHLWFPSVPSAQSAEASDANTSRLPSSLPPAVGLGSDSSRHLAEQTGIRRVLPAVTSERVPVSEISGDMWRFR